MATLDWRKQDAIMGVDRPYAATGNLVARGVEKSSGTTFPATVSGFNPTAPACAPPTSFWNGSACRFDYVSFIDLVPRERPAVDAAARQHEVRRPHRRGRVPARREQHEEPRVADADGRHGHSQHEPVLSGGRDGQHRQLADDGRGQAQRLERGGGRPDPGRGHRPGRGLGLQDRRVAVEERGHDGVLSTATSTPTPSRPA